MSADGTVQRSEISLTNDASGRGRRDRKSNAATGASAAGARAVGSQAIAFYFRAPVKAFFRTRVDYLAFARAINPRVQAQEGWSIRMSTPGLLSHAVKTYGWGFIPNHVLPPLIANIGIGAILYTSYLQTLGRLYPPSSEYVRRVYPPPPPSATFLAGFCAGAVQSVVAAPLDALSVRFRTSDMVSGRYANMWAYGYYKLREIGLRGVFAGWGMNCVKDSLGYGTFFMTFEYVKAQAFYRALSAYMKYKHDRHSARSPGNEGATSSIRPHYAVEPAFLLAAGVSASVVQAGIAHPVSRVQDVYYRSLASLDQQAQAATSGRAILQRYYATYARTLRICAARVARLSKMDGIKNTVGSWRRWLYRGFWWSTIKQVPSTSAGLIIFELVRRGYDTSSGFGRVIHLGGGDVLLD